MTLINSLTLVTLFTLLSGCASTPRLPSISDNESRKYDKKYLSEYESLKNQYHGKQEIQWIQPSNKKESCKVYSGITVEQIQSLDESFKIFWDGSCKNGYANGLGREFASAVMLNVESLAIYKGKRQKPQYYIETFNLDNKVNEGDLNSKYYVETTIKDDGFDFNINYKYGFFGLEAKPQQLTTSSPFSYMSTYFKSYPNFMYQIFDALKDEFQETKYAFYMFNKNLKRDGFGFAIPKSGNADHGEFSNGALIRRVRLPDSFIAKANNMLSEIKQAGQKAIESQKQALKVKKQYMNKICKKSVSVDFIDNEEYKKICNESEYYATLKEKMDEKLSQLNQLKQQKLQQLNQQKLANAAQRQADAAAKAASAAEYANITQSWQNLNNNIQMQQLNNNLMFMRMGY